MYFLAAANIYHHNFFLIPVLNPLLAIIYFKKADEIINWIQVVSWCSLWYLIWSKSVLPLINCCKILIGRQTGTSRWLNWNKTQTSFPNQKCKNEGNRIVTKINVFHFLMIQWSEKRIISVNVYWALILMFS